MIANKLLKLIRVAFDCSDAIVTEIQYLQIDQCIKSSDLLNLIVVKVEFSESSYNEIVIYLLEKISSQNQTLNFEVKKCTHKSWQLPSTVEIWTKLEPRLLHIG